MNIQINPGMAIDHTLGAQTDHTLGKETDHHPTQIPDTEINHILNIIHIIHQSKTIPTKMILQDIKTTITRKTKKTEILVMKDIHTQTDLETDTATIIMKEQDMEKLIIAEADHLVPKMRGIKIILTESMAHPTNKNKVEAEATPMKKDL